MSIYGYIEKQKKDFYIDRSIDIDLDLYDQPKDLWLNGQAMKL
jgi:hypothetical protein